MSWNEYVTNLVGTGNIARAAILGQQGGVWAISGGYELSLEEQKAVTGAFGKDADVQSNGLTLHKRKFFYIDTDVETEGIYLRKGPDGCVVFKTMQAILVAEYVGPTTLPEAVKAAKGVADHLVEHKY